jgi:hypothetical protein
MDIKCKTGDIRTWKKRLFVYISSTNVDTLAPLLYQCVKTRSKEVSFDCCLSHFQTSISTSLSSAKRLAPSLEPLYATNTSHGKQETFLYEYHLH